MKISRLKKLKKITLISGLFLNACAASTIPKISNDPINPLNTKPFPDIPKDGSYFESEKPKYNSITPPSTSDSKISNKEILYYKEYGTTTSDGKSVSGSGINNSLIVSLNPPSNVQNPLAGSFGKKGFATYTIPNDHYAKAADISFGFTSWVNGGAPKSGTAWILDYKIEDDESYPLTWYLGSNAHVFDDVLNDQNYNGYSYPEKLGATWAVDLKKVSHIKKINDNKDDKNALSKIANNPLYPESILYQAKCYPNEKNGLLDTTNKDPCKLKKDDKTNNAVKDYDWDYIISNPNVTNRIMETTIRDKRFFKNHDDNSVKGSFGSFKLLYMGLDYLDSKPNDFSKYFSPQLEEMIDFAVVEIKFPSEIIARAMTNNYAAAKNKSDHSKFLENSYAKNYVTNENFYILGFPVDNVTKTNVITINKTMGENSKDFETNNLEKGQSFLPKSATGYNNTYPDKPGLGDGLIVLPWFPWSTNDYAKINSAEFKKFENPNPWDFEKRYVASGLIYMIANSGLDQGSSGSVVLNSKNEKVGVHFAVETTTKNDFVFAFKSEGEKIPGFEYYNPPAYDIIYGNVKGQKTSYRQALINAYGKEFKTNLFPNGANNLLEKN